MLTLLITIGLTIGIVLLIIYRHFKRKLDYFDEFGIPSLPDGLPILGNMYPLISRKKQQIELVRDIYKSCPKAKYIGAFDFTEPVIVLRDLELIKDMTIKHFDHFTDHKSFFDETLEPLFGGNLFNLKGERWREARNLLSPAFTSSKMRMMFDSMANCAKNMVDHLQQQQEVRKDKRIVIDTKELFTKYANDVVAVCAFGISLNTFEDPDNEFYKFGRDITRQGLGVMIKFFLMRSAPWLLKLLNVKFVGERASKFFKNVVAETVRTRDENGIRRPDMLQLMMDARSTSNDYKFLKLDVAEMTAQAFVFFFAGFESTSTTMSMMAHELAVNPEVQAKLQYEIDKVLRETDGQPTYEAVTEMPYLDAVFNETLRRHSLGGYLERTCSKAYELPPALPGGKSYIVQPGTSIWIPAPAIHRDPNYYEEPDKWDPDRYYPKDNKIKNKLSVNDVMNLGFGIGPRVCVAHRFARMEVKIVFFFLLAKFDLIPNDRTCIPIVYSKKSFMTRFEGGFWLSIVPRT